MKVVALDLFVCWLDLISRLAMREINFFLDSLCSVAEQAGLSLTFSEISKTGFVVSRPKYRSCCRCLLFGGH